MGGGSQCKVRLWSRTSVRGLLEDAVGSVSHAATPNAERAQHPERSARCSCESLRLSALPANWGGSSSSSSKPAFQAGFLRTHPHPLLWTNQWGLPHEQAGARLVPSFCSRVALLST